MNLISIIILLQEKFYIKIALNSVLKQSYRKFEIIIKNDDLNEDPSFIHELKKDKRIKIINNTKRLGAGLSRNKGIKFAKGNLLAFLD